MPRSTYLLIVGFALGQPILWIEHPMQELGVTIFYALAGAMTIAYLAGLSFWAIDRE